MKINISVHINMHTHTKTLMEHLTGLEGQKHKF